MTYLPGVDYFVYYDVFPLAIRGLVTPNDDGTFRIYLNSRYPLSVLQKTLRHEVDHVENDDFYNNCPIEVVENL